MEIEKILKEFLEICSKKLNLLSIIQFGSSTHDKNFHDIDMVFVSNNLVKTTEEILFLIKLMKDFENRYEEVTFDFSGLDRKRKTKYSITVVFLAKGLLQTKYNPSDLFFFKNLSVDKNKKILFGEDPFICKKIKLTNGHLFEMLSVDLSHTLRKCLDDQNYKNEALYFLFKTYLRAFLINDGHYEKSELLDKFKIKFGDFIKLPKNAKDIIKNKIKKDDFEDLLKFCENCLN
jgi:predicted nucleotidyltransferase